MPPARRWPGRTRGRSPRSGSLARRPPACGTRRRLRPTSCTTRRSSSASASESTSPARSPRCASTARRAARVQEVGHLWSADGTLLGTVAFSVGVARPGWQQANLASPVADPEEHHLHRVLPRAGRSLPGDPAGRSTRRSTGHRCTRPPTPPKRATACSATAASGSPTSRSRRATTGPTSSSRCRPTSPPRSSSTPNRPPD